jgi:hypothetical protein
MGRNYACELTPQTNNALRNVRLEIVAKSNSDSRQPVYKDNSAVTHLTRIEKLRGTMLPGTPGALG